MNIPLGKWSGSDATDALHQTVQDFVIASAKQTRTMIGLTRGIVVLTALLLIGLGVQVWIQLGGAGSVDDEIAVSPISKARPQNESPDESPNKPMDKDNNVESSEELPVGDEQDAT